jgi:hypothetical protein
MKLKIFKNSAFLVIASLIFQSPAHGSDAGGFSKIDGTFLSLPPYAVDASEGTIEFNSFDITKPTLSSFRERCAKKNILWINNRETKCLLFRPPTEVPSIYGSSIFIDTPPTAWIEKEQLCAVVSTHPTPIFSTRKPTQAEKILIRSELTAEPVKEAAINLGDRSIIIVGYKNDDQGNLLTRVFVISSGLVKLCGKLPGWPDRFIDMDNDGVPEAIISLNADGFTIVAYSLAPSTKYVAFVGEGG